MQIKPGTPVAGQGPPMVVDRAEQRAPGLAAIVGLDEQRKPACKVGILHRHARHVAAVQIFERVDRRRIDHSRSGRDDDHEKRPVEAARPLEFVKRKPRPFLDRLVPN